MLHKAKAEQISFVFLSYGFALIVGSFDLQPREDQFLLGNPAVAAGDLFTEDSEGQGLVLGKSSLGGNSRGVGVKANLERRQGLRLVLLGGF